MDARPELGKPNVGDTVIVKVHRYRSIETIEATITKVARLFVTITENANNRDITPGTRISLREWRMRMTTQHEDSQYSNADSFVTPEQYAWDSRLTAAQSYLREVGVSVDSRSPHQADLSFRVTLANLLRAHNGLDLI